MKQKRLVELAASNSESPYVQKLLKDFLLANSIAESTAFNLYNYASKEERRPAMTGVLFENGKKVVTDAYSLICLAEPYNPSLEGKIIGPTGAEILESKFPAYESIRPKVEGFEYKFNFEEIAEIYKVSKVEQKILGKLTHISFICNGETMFFDPKFLFKLIVFAKHLKAYTIKFYPTEKKCLVEKGESWGIICGLQEPMDRASIIILS